MAATTTSPRTRDAATDGTTKNAIRRKPELSRRRSVSRTTLSPPTVPDITGNSAAEMDIPNKLTGRVYSVRAWKALRRGRWAEGLRGAGPRRRWFAGRRVRLKRGGNFGLRLPRFPEDLPEDG